MLIYLAAICWINFGRRVFVLFKNKVLTTTVTVLLVNSVLVVGLGLPVFVAYANVGSCNPADENVNPYNDGFPFKDVQGVGETFYPGFPYQFVLPLLPGQQKIVAGKRVNNTKFVQNVSVNSQKFSVVTGNDRDVDKIFVPAMLDGIYDLENSPITIKFSDFFVSQIKRDLKYPDGKYKGFWLTDQTVKGKICLSISSSNMDAKQIIFGSVKKKIGFTVKAGSLLKNSESLALYANKKDLDEGSEFFVKVARDFPENKKILEGDTLHIDKTLFDLSDKNLINWSADNFVITKQVDGWKVKLKPGAPVTDDVGVSIPLVHSYTPDFVGAKKTAVVYHLQVINVDSPKVNFAANQKQTFTSFPGQIYEEKISLTSDRAKPYAITGSDEKAALPAGLRVEDQKIVGTVANDVSPGTYKFVLQAGEDGEKKDFSIVVKPIIKHNYQDSRYDLKNFSLNLEVDELAKNAVDSVEVENRFSKSGDYDSGKILENFSVSKYGNNNFVLKNPNLSNKFAEPLVLKITLQDGSVVKQKIILDASDCG